MKLQHAGKYRSKWENSRTMGNVTPSYRILKSVKHILKMNEIRPDNHPFKKVLKLHYKYAVLI